MIGYLLFYVLSRSKNLTEGSFANNSEFYCVILDLRFCVFIDGTGKFILDFKCKVAKTLQKSRVYFFWLILKD